MPILSGKQVDKESPETGDFINCIEIGGIKKCIEEHSNSRTKISDTLKIHFEKQIDRESLEIKDIEHCIEDNSDTKSKVFKTMPNFFENQWQSKKR